MKAIKLIIIHLTLFSSILFGNSYIVVGTENDIGKIVDTRAKVEKLLSNQDIQNHTSKNIPTIKIVQNHDKPYIKIGPFDRDNNLAINFMYIRRVFPDSFVMNGDMNQKTSVVEKKIYIKDTTIAKPNNDSSDISLWVAVFGLAIIGIFFMFLSSDKLRRLKDSQLKLMEKHRRLEEQQNAVLSGMSENIHSLAKETVNSTNKLAKKAARTALKSDIDKVIDNENELLDIAGDLIKFLRLKANKVMVSNAIFSLNNVLNELIGSVEKIAKNRDLELIFDINKHVPAHIKADSTHILKVLVSLVEYAMLNCKKRSVKLSLDTIYNLTDTAKLKMEIEGNFKIDDKKHLFDAYYDEKQKKYVGLGLFVAKELIGLMDGKLEIISIDENSDKIVITIPIEESVNKPSEKKLQKKLQKSMHSKKILIVDKEIDSSLAIEKLFQELTKETTIIHYDKFSLINANFSQYDMVVLNSNLFGHEIIPELKKLQELKNLIVVSLDNIFNYMENQKLDIVDITLQKPLSVENLYNALDSYHIYGKDIAKDSNIIKEQKASLLVHKDIFLDTEGVSIEDFSNFSSHSLLLVEDNFINQKLMLGLLSRSNMNIRVANNGQEAVDYLDENEGKTDFILMDINMPVLDGFDATAKIRHDKRFDNIPIVALTALVADREVDRMFSLGMNGYLSKPIKIDKLYTAMSTFLDEKSINVKHKHIEQITKFEGLDVVSGLKRTEDNKIFYKEILHEFIDVYGNSDRIFEKLVTEERYEQIRMLCIDMKGLTGTIGAKRMQKVINSVHQNIIYGKSELLHTHINDYKRELNTLKTSIRAYLAQ